VLRTLARNRALQTEAVRIVPTLMRNPDSEVPVEGTQSPSYFVDSISRTWIKAFMHCTLSLALKSIVSSVDQLHKDLQISMQGIDNASYFALAAAASRDSRCSYEQTVSPVDNAAIVADGMRFAPRRT
jgi:hypothetical protein